VVLCLLPSQCPQFFPASRHVFVALGIMDDSCSEESCDGEEIFEDDKQTVAAVEEEVCRCLNKEPEDENAVEILSSCNKLSNEWHWLSDEKRAKEFSFEDIHVHSMALSVYEATNRKCLGVCVLI